MRPGEWQDLIVLSVLSTGPSHGYSLRARIEQSGDGLEVSEASLYGALENYADEGWVDRVGEEIVQNRTRRIFRLTQKGERHLAQRRQEWEVLSRGIDLVLASVSRSGKP